MQAKAGAGASMAFKAGAEATVRVTLGFFGALIDDTVFVENEKSYGILDPKDPLSGSMRSASHTLTAINNGRSNLEASLLRLDNK